jgi:glutaredoxin
MAIEIYSKTNCSFCDKAKQLLRIHGKDYVEYKLDEDFSREILLSKFPEAKTFPVIVVDGFHIGGYDQLQKQINEEISDTRKILLEDNYHGA